MTSAQVSNPSDAGDPSLAMTVEDVCRLALDYQAFRHELASIADIGPLPE